MQLSNQYNFRLTDSSISRTEFVFKVAFDIAADRQFPLAYAPFSRYPSLMMMEYLAATGKEYGASLIDTLSIALRHELVAYETEQIVVGQSGDRTGSLIEMFDIASLPQRIGEEIATALGAERPDAGGQILDERSEGERYRTRPLQVSREHSLSERTSVKDLAKIVLGTQGKRPHTKELLVALERAEGKRPIVKDLALPRAATQGRRLRTQELHIPEISGAGSRLSTWDMTVSREQYRGKRLFTWDGAITRDRYEADRVFNDNPMFINRENGWGHLIEHIRRLKILKSETAQRDTQLNPTKVLQGLIDSHRAQSLHPTWVDREMTRAKLLARQYPALLYFTQTAEREIGKNPAYLHEVGRAKRDISLAQSFVDWTRSIADRYIERVTGITSAYLPGSLVIDAKPIELDKIHDAYTLREAPKGKREIGRSMHVLRSLKDADREIRSTTQVFHELRRGQRVTDVETFVDRYFAQAHRDNERGLWIKDELQTGATPERKLHLNGQNAAQGHRKDVSGLYVPRSLTQGARDTQKPTHVSGELQGRRDIARDLYLDRVAQMAKRIQEKATTLLTGGEASKAPYESIIEEVQLFDKLGKASDMSFVEEIWGVLVKERAAYFLDVIYGYKEFPAELMDEILVGIRNDESPAWIQDLMLTAGEEITRTGFIEEFMAGAKLRLEAIIEAGLVGSTEAFPSLLGFELVGQTEEFPAQKEEDMQADFLFRPAEFHVENPLGWLQPDEAFIPEDVQGGREERSGAVEDTILGQLQERLSELSTDYILGSAPMRGAHLADLYLLGEAGMRDGLIPEDNWPGLAKLAVEQAIIAEGLFGYNPDKAAMLVESIMAFKSGERDGFWIDQWDGADRPNDHAGTIDEEHAEANRWYDGSAHNMEEHSEGYKAEMPAQSMDERILARKMDEGGMILYEILGDRDLAEAVLLDYQLAKRQMEHGQMMETITANEQLRQALLTEADQQGQGLIYDYTDDLLDEGMDPDKWEGGYGVPQDYDPHDPFNDYYPWTEDKDSLALGQDDWIRFDTELAAAWRRNRDLGEFYCEQDLAKESGYYRNDFTHEDYSFETSFKVRDAAGDDAAGIMFRYIDPQNYYMFMINGGDPDDTLGMNRPMQLYKKTAGILTKVGAPMDPFSWKVGTWHQLHVLVVGNRITLTVDGRMQYDFTD
ncbi:family 16 glycoside hydrolase [Paenibacillus xylanexedens]|uniref:family 16 glycoside hydrolase n=1 Tax=Paenibacillus xylanexedens TaxID=528191 RepID=UPI00119E8F71|nr:family 16 glycoside hydrolase [Paenibacillus xylanexedens]